MQSLKYFTKGGKDKTNKKNYKPTTSNQAYTLPERKRFSKQYMTKKWNSPSTDEGRTVPNLVFPALYVHWRSIWA